ncbi:MAG: aspartate/glutamate racemase family protein [Pseudomonadota bacterium]
MPIVLINPNSTAAMTESMVEAARAAAPGAVFEGRTSLGGPPAIQGREDGEASVPPLLEEVRRASSDGASAIIIGCFDDTGLAEAQEIAACPVIGIGQAAYHLAAMIGPRFSVVTTLAVSVPVLEENIVAQGLGPSLGRVRASGVPVLALEDAPETALPLIEAEIARAAAEDGAAAVALGCGGMATHLPRLRAAAPVPLIDGVVAAAAAAAAL